jgi:hypothetical protein
MRKLLLTAILILSCFFFVASVFVSVLIAASMHPSERLIAIVLVGDVLTFVPSIFVMRRLQDGYTQRDVRKHGWDIALRGAPLWLRKSMKALGWCIIVCLFLFFLLPKPGRDKASIPFLLPLYLGFLSVYSAAILYSALHIDPNQPKCPNGHPVNSLQKFCPECGAPIAQPAMDA